jgi:hypothetical protein
LVAKISAAPIKVKSFNADSLLALVDDGIFPKVFLKSGSFHPMPNTGRQAVVELNQLNSQPI